MSRKVKVLVCCMVLLAAGMVNAKLVCHYPFDGNLDDSSVNNYPAGDGSLVGDTQYVEGKYGEALDFDGDGDFVQLMVAPDPNNTEGWGWKGTYMYDQPKVTIAMWVKMADYPFESTNLLATRSWLPGDNNIEISGLFGFQTPFFIVSNGIYPDEYPHKLIPPEKLGNWFHLAVTYDTVAGEANMYIDGVPGSAVQITSGALVNIGNYTLGGNAGIDARYFDGQIDELYIYSQVLSPQEITDLMDGIEPEEEFVCGDSGYLPGDVNKDCNVDLKDLAVMSSNWLKCTDMNLERCEMVPLSF